MVRSVAFSVIMCIITHLSASGDEAQTLIWNSSYDGGGGAVEAASLVFLLEVFLINQAGQLFELFSRTHRCRRFHQFLQKL
jgi:hypothetical protein